MNKLNKIKEITNIYSDLKDYHTNLMSNSILIPLIYDEIINDDLSIKKVDCKDIIEKINLLIDEKYKNIMTSITNATNTGNNNIKNKEDEIKSIKKIKIGINKILELKKEIDYKENISLLSNEEKKSIYEHLNYIICDPLYMVLMYDDELIRLHNRLEESGIKAKTINYKSNDTMSIYLKLNGFKLLENILNIKKEKKENIENLETIELNKNVKEIALSNLMVSLLYAENRSSKLNNYMISNLNEILKTKKIELPHYIVKNDKILKELKFNDNLFNSLIGLSNKDLYDTYIDQLNTDQIEKIANISIDYAITKEKFKDTIKNKSFFINYINNNRKTYGDANFLKYYKDEINNLDGTNDLETLKLLCKTYPSIYSTEEITTKEIYNKKVLEEVLINNILDSKIVTKIKKENPEIEKLDSLENIVSKFDTNYYYYHKYFSMYNNIYAKELNKEENFEDYKKLLKASSKSVISNLHIPFYVIKDINKVLDILSFTNTEKITPLLQFFNKIYDQDLRYVSKIASVYQTNFHLYPEKVQDFLNAVTKRDISSNDKLIFLNTYLEKKRLSFKNTVGIKPEFKISCKNVYTTCEGLKSISLVNENKYDNKPAVEEVKEKRRMKI